MEPATDTASNASEMSAGSAGSRASPRKSPPPRAHSPQHLMAPRLPPLPPPALGLLGSLQMMHHASPLDLMAAAHHHGPPRSYGSPPPISSSDPSANECKLVDYRGHKVAAFIIQGDTMLCLPQAFELFLKHLVGGLHTVYTKLKRLDIVPLVCNVEQVRILRGLGAIQPGVNRCKLLSCKDFDVLYRDCTTARCLSMKGPDSSRPGRPPKRASVGLSLTPTHMSQNPFKKHRMENGEYSPYENGHLGDMGRMDKSPLLANGYNPPPHMNPMGFMHAQHAALMSPSLAAQMQRHESNMVKGQHQMHSMEALARSGIWENCRAAYEDIVKHLERLRDERSDVERALALDHKIREGSQNGSSPGHSPVLNLSKSGDRASAAERISTGDASHSEAGSGVASPSIHHRTPPPSTRSHRSASSESDAPISELDEPNDKDDPDGELTDDEHDERANSSPTQQTGQIYTPVQQTSSPPLPQQQQQQQQQQVVDGGVNSTETLLRNIQGLLKVAADNARQQERQITYEKAELKMDVIREREVKDNIERQLLDEQKLRVLYQKRYKKERRERQRLQEQLDVELRKHNKLEEALRQSAPTTDLLRILSETESTSSGVVTSGGGVTEEACNSPPVQPASRDQTTTPTTPASGGGDVQTSTPPPTSEKQWHTNYPQPRLDLVSTGAAFWQNYSESLAQELEMERKSRQQAMERDVKSPLSERTPYYKSSVVFSGAT